MSRSKITEQSVMEHLLLLSVIICFSASNAAISEEFVNANNLFAGSFYKQISSTTNSNFLISPFSAETVLAFVQSGCKDATAHEIRNSLYLPNDQTKVENAIIKSLPELAGNELYTLRTANKMYVKNNYSIKEEFKKSAGEVYGADVENVDFKENVKAAKIMNQWVKEQTNNQIRDLISPDRLNEVTRTILINAPYFKGNWIDQFNNFSTKLKDFYKNPNDVIKVDTMHLWGKWLNYYENYELDAKFLELRFEGGDISMVVVLPNKTDGLASLEGQIDKVFARQNFKSNYLNVALPKFKIESEFSLKNPLQNLGIRKAFDGKEADLSGIAGVKGDLVIDDVLQKTFIEVEEDGVEAATFVSLCPYLGCIESESKLRIKPKKFTADHPFLFYIKVKNFIVFAGKVVEPKAA